MEGSMIEQTENPVREQNGDINTEAPNTNGGMNGTVENHMDSDPVSEMKAEVRKEHKSGEHRHSSSSSKHKSSHSDKHRSSSGHHKSSHSDRHKDGHKSSSSDKHKHSSSSDKHKSSSSSSKDKHHSSSHSSSKDKHSSSSSSKHHSSSSKDKPHHSSSKHSSSSSSKHHSSSGDKSKHSSSSGDKSRSDKDKHRSDKDRHHSDKHKEKKERKEEKSEDKKEKKPDMEIKQEPQEEMAVKSETMSPRKIKSEPTPMEAEPTHMEDSDDDMPLAARKDTFKKEPEKRAADEDSDDEPLSARMDKAKKIKTEDGTPVRADKVKHEASTPQKMKKRKSEEDEDFTPIAKKKKKEDKKKKGKEGKTPVKEETASPKKGRAKREQPEEEKWKWWEEAPKEDGKKWNFLEHKGVVFAPEYEPLPSDVKFYYDGKQVKLSNDAEEVAGFYAKMLEHDYTTRDVFNKNFFKDWRKMMTKEEKELITDLKKCNFSDMLRYFKEKQEERKNLSKEEKKKIKEANEAVMKEHGYCIMDGHKEKMGNFRIEPPGLFRGRGEHPKQGCLKRRVVAEDIIINCSKDSVIPQAPPGHHWKEVRHDSTVTWLASWTENVQNQTKYVMLAATSRLKGEKDWNKYETARKLHKCVDKIRAQYRDDWKSKEMRLRQRAVALYFIDKLALRAGNEKDEDTADTVGCCSLRYEHITLHEEKDGKEYVVEFDFLGKDSIRYHNEVGVEKRVFKNLQLFMENKNDGDDLFDRLNTTIMNKHLNNLMDGLTAKVFRTYNASRTLQEQLDNLTNPEDPVAAKILAYNRANRAVAILCNHQRAVSKNFGKQMENLQNKIEAKKDAIRGAKKEYKDSKSDYKALNTEGKRKVMERKKKAVERLEEQLQKLEISLTDKDENKEIALGTSKLNYLDPRISVAWCKKWQVPIEKIYNKTQREKFAWAIEMADEDYKFTEMEDE